MLFIQFLFFLLTYFSHLLFQLSPVHYHLIVLFFLELLFTKRGSEKNSPFFYIVFQESSKDSNIENLYVP